MATLSIIKIKHVDEEINNEISISKYKTTKISMGILKVKMKWKGPEPMITYLRAINGFVEFTNIR